MFAIRKKALTRLAIFCLGTSALTAPVLAASFSVGGGTITTTQADNSQDNTGSSGGFLLQPNTVGNNDAITITGVTINNTSGTPNGRALDLGYSLSSSGSYSITMQGSNLSGTAGSGVAGLIASSSGGNISFDTTGGASNTIAGSIGVNLNGNGGNVSIKTGADTITTSGPTGEILYATTTGTGTIAIDTAGATLRSNGTYGISAVNGGSGAVTIGGLNGGIASSIIVNSGYGIYVTSVSNVSVTIALSGSVTALNGMYLQSNADTVNNFGTISAANNAIDASFANSLNVNLQSGSTTSGIVLGSTGADTFTLFGGATIAGATFNGSGGSDTLVLTGSGNGSIAVSSVSNVEVFQKTGTGTWTLTGTTTNLTPWTVSGGTLAIANDAALGFSSGTLVLDGGALQATATTAATRAITLGASGGTLNVATGATLTENGAITGTGGLTVTSPINGTIVLGSANTYSGGTIINDATLRLGADNGLPTTGRLQITSFGTFDLNGHAQTLGGLTGGVGTVLAIGGGTLTINQAADGGQGAVTGTGSIIFNGPAELSLGERFGHTNFIGDITVNGGTLLIESLGGNITINGGTLETSLFRTFNFGTLSGTGGVLNMSDSFFTFTSNTDSTFAGQIVDAGSGQFIKAGTGTLTLTGNSTPGSSIVISGGTLQFGNGGTSGLLQGAGGVTDNGRLVFNRSDDFTFASAISGTGSVTKLGAGKLTLTSLNNSYSGGTTITAGTLVANSLAGDVTDSGALVLNFNGTYAGVVSGTGSVQVAGGNTLVLTGAHTYTGGTTISAGTLQLGTGGSLASTGALAVNGGTFDLNSHSQTVGALSGTGGAITLGSGTLTTSSSTNTSLAAAISGSGSLIKAGTGTLSLTGANTYTGGTTVSGGALQIGGGGTSGSLAGNVTNNAALIFNRSDALAFTSVISGMGSVAQAGAGTLTLSGTNTYTGATNVNAGTLNVTGAVAGSSVSVANGATLTGTGRVGTTTVASGGTLTPGSASSPGTLSVNGNLTLASGANYFDAVTPTAASLTTVSGSASVNGSFAASLASGAYTLGQRYTVLTATGGVSGTFASLSTVGIPTYVRGRLSYDANNVYLNLDPNVLAPSLSNASANQRSVVSAIDAAVLAGGTPSGGFLTLYGLSGAALNSALNQISGQIGPNTANAVGQGSLSFLAMTGAGGSDSGNFAPGSAYGSADAPHRAQLGSGETRIWGSVYGGHVGLSADTASGAASLSASNVGFIAGADMGVDDGLLAGVTVGFGRQNFSSGNGTGDSDDVMIGLYARKEAGPLYVTAAFGYGWHQITTQRVVTVSGTDILQGKQDADDFGGRVEAGWRMVLDDQYALSPYAAIAAESFEAPAYVETAVSGASTFALSVAAHSSTLGRSELGAGLARNYQTGDGVLAADVRLAWAHQLDDLPFTQVTFQGLPGASFVVTGVHPASDTALLGAGFEVRRASGLFFGVKAESQLGAGTTILEGMGNLGWRW